MPSPGSKHCPSCGVAIPNSYTRCLLCLGKAYPKECCLICLSFKKRSQGARDLRLKRHLLEQAMWPALVLRPQIALRMAPEGGLFLQHGTFPRLGYLRPGKTRSVAYSALMGMLSLGSISKRFPLQLAVDAAVHLPSYPNHSPGHHQVQGGMPQCGMIAGSGASLPCQFILPYCFLFFLTSSHRITATP